MMVRTMENKPLQIPVLKKWKGLTVYCKKCKTNVSDICKENGKSIKQCQYGDKHFYKLYLHVPGTANERKTKSLGRDLDSAIKQAMEFEKELKENNYQKATVEKKESNQVIKKEKINQPSLLIHVLGRYIGFLNNEEVPAHRFKERSREHIKDVERAFKCLVQCLKENGHDIKTVLIDDIDDNLVGEVYIYLNNKGFANRTFNKYLTYYTSFLKWYADEYNYPIRNWFDRVKRKKLNPNPEAIMHEEYEMLLRQITQENGIKKYENGIKPTRNLYRPWLADGIRLALETGRRREEVINLKWNDIEESDGISYIKTEDYKVNRIQGRKTDEEKKFNFIPVTDSLRKLLNEMGYEKNRNTDGFMLAPEIMITRKRVMSDILTRGFSHYYSQLNTGRTLTFKSLRKAYITNLQIYMGGNTKSITGHSDDKVIERNYIDKKELAKAAQNFTVFSKEVLRTDELQQIRKETKSNQKNREV